MPDVTEKPLQHRDMSEIWERELSICGCGDPQAIGAWVHKALRLIEKRYAPGSATADFEALHRHFGDDDEQPARYYGLWCWLDSAGLLEHGGIISGSWLTDKGEAFLSFLDSPEGAIVLKSGGFAWDMEGNLVDTSD